MQLSSYKAICRTFQKISIPTPWKGFFRITPHPSGNSNWAYSRFWSYWTPTPPPGNSNPYFLLGRGGGAGGLDYVRYFLKLHSVIYNFCFWFLICKFFSNLRGDKNKHRPPNFFNFLGNQIVHDRFSCDFVVSILCLPNFIGRCFSYFIVGNAWLDFAEILWTSVENIWLTAL